MSDQIEQQCARCGSCTAVCPVYRVTGRESLTARAKLHLLGTDLAETPSAAFEDLFAQCLLCGACENECPRELPIRHSVVTARSRFSTLYGQHGLQKNLARLALARPLLLEGLLKAGLALDNLALIPSDSGLHIKLGLVEQGKRHAADRKKMPRPAQGGQQPAASYFVGCHARYLQPSVADATSRLVGHVTGIPPHEPEDQVCCGLAAWSAGKKDEARRLAKANIEAFDRVPGPVLASCASCSAHLATYPELFAGEPEWRLRAEQFAARVSEFAAFMLDTDRDSNFRAKEGFRLMYHEPCHLRFAGKRGNAPRVLLQRVDNIIRVEPEGGPHCCGQGGLFHLGYPELADKIFAMACESSIKPAPDIVVTGCSGCLMQWQAGLAMRRSPVKAIHLAVFLAGCLDIDL